VLKKKVNNSVALLCFRSLKSETDPNPKQSMLLILLVSVCQMMEEVQRVNECDCNIPLSELTELIMPKL
jgi:hypothetical protein